MNPYYSFASYLRSCFYDTFVLQVQTTLKSLQKCDRGFDMYNDLKLALKVVEELGRPKLVDALAKESDIGTQASGCSWWSGGSQGCGCCGGGQAGYGLTTELKPIYEEGDDSSVEESWLEGDWVLSDGDGGTPRCTSGAGAGPSHTIGHEDIVPAQTMFHGASMDYEDPSRISPLVFNGSAHGGGCIFVPTLGMPTPPLVHVEPTVGPSSLTPHKEVVQI